MLRSFAWAVMACMLALCGAPSRAAACSPPTNWLELPDVPANGVVRFALHCEVSDCFEDGDLENLGVIDTTTGAAVAGQVVVREEQVGSKLALAWKPAAPLVAGRTYAIDWRPPVGMSFFSDAAETFDFVALPAATWTLDVLHAEPLLLMQSRGESSVSCPIRQILDVGGLCFLPPNTASVVTSQRNYVELSVDVISDVPYEQVEGQYEARAAIWAQGDEQPALGNATFPRVMFQSSWDDQHDGYCYRVELRSLIDDTTAVQEDCVEHGVLGDAGVVPVAPAALKTALGPCIEPPEGLEVDWCGAHRSSCRFANETTELSCDEVEAQCTDVPGEPTAMPDAGDDIDVDVPDHATGVIPEDIAGNGGAGAAGAAGASGMSGEEMTPSHEATPDDMAITSSGCGCSAIGARSSNGALALLMLAGCTLLARARSARRRR